jgi:cytochrome c biogenesis protein CcmG/thiol:disulfide interchange protein DsbE
VSVTPLRAGASFLAVGALVAALGFGLSRDPRALPVTLLDDPAPRATLERLQVGGKMTIPVPGRPTLINVWASWCPPCKREFPVLRAGWRRWGKQVAFVGLVYQDNPKAANRFLTERGDPPGGSYPNLLDPGSRTAIDYGIYGIPETFFIDRRGRIRAKVVGELQWKELERNMEVILPR